MQQLRVAAACCSWACALFSFALQQDRSTVQTAVFSFTYLLGLGSSADALSVLSKTNQLLRMTDTVADCRATTTLLCWVSAVAQDHKGQWLHNRESVSSCCNCSRAYKADHKRAGENVAADQARLLEIPRAQTRCSASRADLQPLTSKTCYQYIPVSQLSQACEPIGELENTATYRLSSSCSAKVDNYS